MPWHNLGEKSGHSLFEKITKRIEWEEDCFLNFLLLSGDGRQEGEEAAGQAAPGIVLKNLTPLQKGGDKNSLKI